MKIYQNLLEIKNFIFHRTLKRYESGAHIEKWDWDLYIVSGAEAIAVETEDT